MNCRSMFLLHSLQCALLLMENERLNFWMFTCTGTDCFVALKFGILFLQGCDSTPENDIAATVDDTQRRSRS